MSDYFISPYVKYGFEFVIVAGILLAGTLKQRKMERAKNAKNDLATEDAL
jgi:hypothetical protein